MNIKMKITCKNYTHKKSINNKLIVTSKSEEYYIIPLNKGFEIETDGELYQLIFENQLLWLKYSNVRKEILMKEFDFDEFIIIHSEDILDIYLNIHTNRCFKHNVWHTSYNLSLNKKYSNKYFLIIPIFEDMISIKEYGEGIKNYQIHMISNEVVLKQAIKRSEHNCSLILNNNILLNKEALFIELKDNDMEQFLP